MLYLGDGMPHSHWACKDRQGAVRWESCRSLVSGGGCGAQPERSFQLQSGTAFQLRGCLLPSTASPPQLYRRIDDPCTRSRSLLSQECSSRRSCRWRFEAPETRISSAAPVAHQDPVALHHCIHHVNNHLYSDRPLYIRMNSEV